MTVLATADTVLDRPITTRTIIAKGVNRAANVCQSSSKTGGSAFRGINHLVDTYWLSARVFGFIFCARASDMIYLLAT